MLDRKDKVEQYFALVSEGAINDRATLYALMVRDGEIVAGPHVRGSCKRHLQDFMRDDIYWDLNKADHICDFFSEALNFFDGDLAGEPFKLEPWQCFVLGCIFGWMKKDSNSRKYETAYIEIGKGNGKSPMVGGVGIYLMAADGENAAEVYAAATKLDQAKIMWGDAGKMVKASPILTDVDVKRDGMYLARTNSFFKPISSEKRGLDGPRVHGGLIDELHEHADAVVVNKLRAGKKGRKQPLFMEITNSGVDRNSICYMHHDYSIRILKGGAQDDAWFSYIAALDEGDDWETDESCWIKANPNLGVSIKVSYLRSQVKEAKGMPATRSVVERLNFCRWVGAVNPWIKELYWQKCLVKKERINWEKVSQFPCYMGIDLSMKKDLTALAAVWRIPQGLIGRVFYFMPEENCDALSDLDKMNYRWMAQEGHLTLVPGSIVNYGWIVEFFLKDFVAKNNIIASGFDPWRIGLFAAECADYGVDLKLVNHGQGFQKGGVNDKSTPTIWMPQSIERWEEHILGGTYWVEDTPPTIMCAANAVTLTDPAGNRKFYKEKATGRMDGTVAQAMAVGTSHFNPTNVSVYEHRGMVSV